VEPVDCSSCEEGCRLRKGENNSAAPNSRAVGAGSAEVREDPQWGRLSALASTGAAGLGEWRHFQVFWSGNSKSNYALVGLFICTLVGLPLPRTVALSGRVCP
jgi:hypothetical protein